MVYRGKPSLGCANCRKRKIKCSQDEPACSQCIKSGRECSGYRDQLSLKFLDETSNVVKKAQSEHVRKPSKGNLSRDTAPTGHLILDRAGAGGKDPFSVFPVALQACEMQELYEFCSSMEGNIEVVMLPPSSYQAMKHTWLTDILLDPLSTYSALALSVSRLSFLSGQNLPIRIYKYQLEATMILKAIITDPVRAVSEATIFSILLLATQAITNRDMNSAYIHLNGIKEILVRRHRQKNNTELSRHIKQLMFSVTLCFDTVFGTVAPLSAPYTDISGPLCIPQVSASCPALRAGLGFSPLCHLSDAADHFMNIICEIRVLLVMFAMMTRKGDSPRRLEQYLPRLSFIEARLSEYVHSNQPPHDVALKSDIIVRACSVGTILFVKIVMRQADGSFSETQELATELSLILQDFRDAVNLEEQFLEVLLWILFMGSLGSEGDVQAWFSKSLFACAKALDLKDETQIQQSLDRFFWAPLTYTGRLRKLWVGHASWRDVSVLSQGSGDWFHVAE